ncbi:MAG TPA: fatty acid desaturase [Sphingomicrobium sp.]|nr:fatty acid desaturase [Sphingomicrobium sp.]
MNDMSLPHGGFARVGDEPVSLAVRERAQSDDRTMLRAAADLTRDLNTANPRIYWADFLGSALLGYLGLGVALLTGSTGTMMLAGLVGTLALYRAGSFIHELTHIKHSQLPGFRLAWNMLFGVPLLVPSFLYEGVHNMHHAKTRYGTAEDPEYLPLALMKPWSLPLFLLFAALSPLLLIGRFAIAAPLSMLSPRLRELVVARYSGLQINPHFRRRAPEGEFRRQWLWQEAACSIWALTLVTLAVTGVVPLREFAIFLAIASGVLFLNQVRTLVAHLWENDGEPMTVTAQYLDSVNVPPPATLPALWAPVGLRYHALHHLLPGVPYHNLGEAHRRVSAVLNRGSVYHATSHRGLTPLLLRLAKSTLGRR